MSTIPAETILTFTGRTIMPLAPRVEDIDINDIAHALAMKCRFTGHTSEFYSVAQHSVLVSKAVTGGHELWGLLHDAGEAYLPDVAKPIKSHFPELVKAEDAILRLIAEKFDLQWPIPQPVHATDRGMLRAEQANFMKMDLAFMRENGIHIEPWCPLRSKAEFLGRFVALTESRR